MKKVRKIIRALLKLWEIKETTFKELNDLEEIYFSEFIENLKTNEMEMNVHEGREPPEKKSIAFKPTPSFGEENESIDEGEE